MEGNANSTTQQGFSYFGMQSSWGVTKHMGGLKATARLAELCHVGSNTHVLEVGSGVGVSACYLAKHFGCRITGIDLSEKMVEWARMRAERKGLSSQVQFRVADAQALPFPDDSFDVVLCESVLAFPPDKQRVVNEYARVAKVGGTVGLNEGTWLSPPPEDLVSYAKRTMSNAVFLTPEGWTALLVNAGLRDVTASPQAMNAFRQRLDEMAGLDAQDWMSRISAMGRFLVMYARDSGMRRYAKEIMPSRSVIRSLFRYLGYGFYLGRKAAADAHR